MDQWLIAFGNLGGMGMLASALLILHRDALNRFSRELALERQTNMDQANAERAANQLLWKSYMELKIRQHEQVITMLAGQDKTLERILNSQERIMDRITYKAPIPERESK